MRKVCLALTLAVLCPVTTWSQAVTMTASAIKQHSSASEPSGACSRGAVRIYGSIIYICPQSGTAEWVAGTGGSGTPAGSGTELQRKNGSSFAALTGSSVSGANLTLGGDLSLSTGTSASITAKLGKYDWTDGTPGDYGTLSITTYGNTTSSFVRLKTARGTAASPTAVQADGYIGSFSTIGHDGTSFTEHSDGTLTFFAQEDFTGTNHPTYAVVALNPASTTPSSSSKQNRLLVNAAGGIGLGGNITSAANLTGAKMVVTSAGDVGINTVSPFGLLHVSGGLARFDRSDSTTTALGDAVSGVVVHNSNTTTGNYSKLSFTGIDSGATLRSVATIGAKHVTRASGSITGALVFAVSNDSATPTDLAYLTAGGLLGLGQSSPTASFEANRTAFSGRETLLKGTITDAGNTQAFLGNATSSDSAFVPMYGGYQVDGAREAVQFRALTSAASDASDSSTFGLLDFAAFRTDNATDPNNGTLSAIVNRRLMTVRGGTGSGDIRFSVRASGVLGNDNGVTFANLGTAANTFAICTDCQVTSGADNTCTSGGTGAFAVRLNSVWRCFAAQN